MQLSNAANLLAATVAFFALVQSGFSLPLQKSATPFTWSHGLLEIHALMKQPPPFFLFFHKQVTRSASR